MLLLETNSHISSTPSTELQMGMGHPVAFNSEIQSHSSLGIDCHSNNSGSIISEMRLLLQSTRSIYSDKFTETGKVNKTVNKTVEEVFNLGTIGGARAVGMEDRIGSLAVGKFADIVIFDGLSPGMVCAAQHDPVAAIVLHSSSADIEMVIVGGVVRKQEGVLKTVDTGAGRELWSDGVPQKFAWKEIARELLKRRQAIQKTFEGLEIDEALEGLKKAWYIDGSKIVEKL
jgi:cytosine/adenosine deaminase-related metal-dependent hydrolase